MKNPTNTVLSEYGTTIFTTMSALAAEHGSINLGQGFPDVDGPEEIRQIAADGLMNGSNQYPPMMGLPELRQAVAAHNKRFYGLDVDWQSEVMVTSGATEALCDCFMGLLNPGDEVVLIEPLYDCYLPIIRHIGAVPKLVRVEPPHWELPRTDLEAAFSDKTKLLVLNSPMNPSGKVFNQEELSFLAGLLEKHDAYAVCDEVYEHLYFDGHEHHPLMSLPNMRERCARIGSAGKTFSLTGWKIGYITAAPALMSAIAKAHQFVTFTTPPNLQKAVAAGLNFEEEYFSTFTADMQAQRDILAQGLTEVGFKVLESEGTYFLTADFSPLGFEGDDLEFCRHITIEAGVTAVPTGAFYQSDGPTKFVRFCFCKQPALLGEAVARLKAHFC
ncbi:Methionine aminotransferase [Candidatus Terasakiella magnetica]|uniref:Methionine aminotransferase n=1 Tax=Candidatus Terasakiella magnetica TaxID=1867952 RepID=A0A1C3RES6_9PROT|nr:aminotransferase [Candidatus Terasakiella magnetica]SCA55790.1 Methionine aminotransferase [Candidatus Terasakiella magnetica]